MNPILLLGVPTSPGCLTVSPLPKGAATISIYTVLKAGGNPSGLYRDMTAAECIQLAQYLVNAAADSIPHHRLLWEDGGSAQLTCDKDPRQGANMLGADRPAEPCKVCGELVALAWIVRAVPAVPA